MRTKKTKGITQTSDLNSKTLEEIKDIYNSNKKELEIIEQYLRETFSEININLNTNTVKERSYNPFKPSNTEVKSQLFSERKTSISHHDEYERDDAIESPKVNIEDSNNSIQAPAAAPLLADYYSDPNGEINMFSVEENENVRVVE